MPNHTNTTASARRITGVLQRSIHSAIRRSSLSRLLFTMGLGRHFDTRLRCRVGEDFNLDTRPCSSACLFEQAARCLLIRVFLAAVIADLCRYIFKYKRRSVAFESYRDRSGTSCSMFADDASHEG